MNSRVHTWRRAVLLQLGRFRHSTNEWRSKTLTETPQTSHYHQEHVAVINWCMLSTCHRGLRGLEFQVWTYKNYLIYPNWYWLQKPEGHIPHKTQKWTSSQTGRRRHALNWNYQNYLLCRQLNGLRLYSEVHICLNAGRFLCYFISETHRNDCYKMSTGLKHTLLFTRLDVVKRFFSYDHPSLLSSVDVQSFFMFLSSLVCSECAELSIWPCSRHLPDRFV